MGFRKKIQLIVAISFAVVFFCIVAFEIFSEDVVIDAALNKTSPTSTYSEIPSFNKVHHYQILSDFHPCLLKYRSLAARKLKSGSSGSPANTTTFDIWVKPNIKFSIGISNGEAFQFEAHLLDNDFEVTESSKSYAINCPVELLGSV
ncbi:hypothetical protein [Bowmanella dokdonensis]|uniref:Uncharacterized protein n=1 Tax=Bowmanella dokdonensis TaxID=751969 RepID=A0A939IR25_9ALTE|nr:hypothetical protein [Bowmanella dokdonensis]MBN7825197.1 hypothetical protein [Bowmanella dokdonensis]